MFAKVVKHLMFGLFFSQVQGGDHCNPLHLLPDAGQNFYNQLHFIDRVQGQNPL
jgi:hypothetical protein